MAERAASRRLRAWLPVALWAALILALSGDGFSASSTSRVIGPLLRGLFPDISSGAVDSVHFVVRKGGHAVGYGVLALLALRAELAGGEGVRASALARVLLLTAVVAGADELRQSSLAQRTGSASDVGLDLAGGVVALALALGVRRWSASRRGTA